MRYYDDQRSQNAPYGKKAFYTRGLFQCAESYDRNRHDRRKSLWNAAFQGNCAQSGSGYQRGTGTARFFFYRIGRLLYLYSGQRILGHPCPSKRGNGILFPGRRICPASEKRGIFRRNGKSIFTYSGILWTGSFHCTFQQYSGGWLWKRICRKI